MYSRELASLGGIRILTVQGSADSHTIPAEHQGVDDDLGTIEPGKLADMAFVEGNPLEQITDAIQVRMTMKNGELFTIQDLVEPFSS